MKNYRQHTVTAEIRDLTLLLLLPWGAFAQQPAPPRPKVGIAFEGGGALGFAHVGVLKWLEEHRIPVDYIAGTSMGGLVGGLYATGMRSAELEDLVMKMDWNEALGGTVPFEASSYRRKEDRREFQNGLEFGLRHGLSAPSGLAPGQNVTFLLDREVLPYSQLKSFDELPIPFRCVATDLVSGKAFVFKDGPLGEALRSTMSIPAVFSPVSRDGNLFADGMLMDNLPVDIVKQMGADIVIAVYLANAPYTPEGNQSLFAILNRSIGVMVAANEIHNLETADLVISASLEGYTSGDFTKGKEIIPRGYAATARKASLLTRLSLDEKAWRQYMTTRESRRIHSVPTPEFIQITGASGQMSHDLEKTLAENVGKPIDTKQLEQDINVIMGIGRFNGFSYRLAEQDGRNGLMLRATEKDHAPPLLNFGFLIDGSDLDNVRFTMNARITALDVGGYRSELRTDISVGANWGLSSEYYKLLGKSNWFVAPRGSATSNPFDLYDHSTLIAEYRIRQVVGGLDVGYAIDRFSELRLGYQAGYLDSSLRIGSPVLPTPSGRLGQTVLRYNLNRLDSPVIPRSGEIVSVRAQWNDANPGSNSGFPVAELSFGLVHRISRPGSVFLQGAAGSIFGYENTGIPEFFLGGSNRLAAYGSNEIRTNQYWLARAGYIHELFPLPPIVGNKVYLTSGYEVAKAYGITGVSLLPMDGFLGLVIDTLVGPLSIGGSYGDSGHHAVYFRLGRFF